MFLTARCRTGVCMGLMLGLLTACQAITVERGNALPNNPVKPPARDLPRTHELPRTEKSDSTAIGWVEYGTADYYSDILQGRSTTSGELYDREKLTAAHATLPFGTICRITNLANERSVDVRINDRGPLREGRILHLSYRAARELNAITAGVIDVQLEVIKRRQF